MLKRILSIFFRRAVLQSGKRRSHRARQLKPGEERVGDDVLYPIDKFTEDMQLRR